MSGGILITGSRGFIGTNVREKIILPYEEVDLVLKTAYQSIVGRTGTLIHLAAWRREDESFWHPEKYIDNNLRDFSLLLARNNFSKVIFASSNAVYDKNGYLEPYSIYGLTKLAGEKLIKIYCSNYWILRIAQPYGPYDRMSVFYKLAQCKKLDGMFRLHNSPKLRRDYFHVHHICDVINRILVGEIKKGIYNVGSGKALMISPWLKYMCERYDIDYEMVTPPVGTSMGFIATENLLKGEQGDLEGEWLKYQ